MSKDLKELLAGADKSVTAQYFRRRIAGLERQMAKLNVEVGRQKVFAQDVAAAIVSLQPLPNISPPKASKSKSPVTAVLKLSDWHIGEQTRKEETEGFGAYNYRIAEDRLHTILQSFAAWVDLQRLAYPIEECAVFCEGDFISGDIHDELRVTNEFPLPVQTAKAGLLMAEVVHFLAPRFERVKLYEVGADNHGRLVRKPQAKQKTSNNMNYLVYEVCNQACKDLPNVEAIRGEGAKLLINVNGWKFLLEHGDGVRGWMGIPYYGIERSRGREAIRRMNTPKGFDYQSIGHWHVPGILGGNIFVNGSLSGTSEFDYQQTRHAPPSQMALLVHRERGAMGWMFFQGN